MFEKGEPPVFDSGMFLCRLDIHPMSPGHALVIPKRHVMRLSELRTNEWQELRGAIIRAMKVPPQKWEVLYRRLRNRQITKNSVWFIDRALAQPRSGTLPDGFNHIVNEGEAAGQTVQHLHWHIIPRYVGDVADPKGGGRYVIPELGNYTNPRA